MFVTIPGDRTFFNMLLTSSPVLITPNSYAEYINDKNTDKNKMVTFLA